MVQRSRPQAGNMTLNPTYVDAGPYAADRWATLFRVLFTGDQQATQGVLKTVWDELEPTHPIANREVRIGTGVGVCNGHNFFNDTNAVTIGVDAGVARSDTLVMLENNTNAAIAAGPATNYNTVGPDTAIPPYSCRLAVVKGVAITQTTALFMTPLATFTTGAVTFTNFTDARTYCAFSTEVNTENLADDAVDDTKVGNRVPQFYRRQGDDSSDWNVPGDTNYIPTSVRMQAGTIEVGSDVGGEVRVFFPVAFSDVPLVYVTPEDDYTVSVNDITATRFDITDGGTLSLYVHWLAIGPE